MKNNTFLFKVIKYIVIIVFIYFILNYFKLLPDSINIIDNNEINKMNKANEMNEHKLKNLESVCPLTVFNPNIENSKTSKVHDCSAKEKTTTQSNKQCMLGNIYLEIEKCNSL